MSTSSIEEGRGAGTTGVDKAQYGLAAFVVLVGGVVLYDATGLEQGFSDQPVQPYALSYVVGGTLVLLGILLAVATARGDRPQAEEGEDVDLSHPTDLKTIGMLAAVLLANVLLIDFLGWAVTGGLLFAGAAFALGSRAWVRDLAIGVALAIASWYGFVLGLGQPIPPGILDGVL